MNSNHHILWISLLRHLALPRNKDWSQGHCFVSTEEIQQNGTAGLTAIPKKLLPEMLPAMVGWLGTSAVSAEGLYFKSD
jgi:hypothetical protein